MDTICCVHAGYELYGSDRTFISCLQFLKERYPQARLRVIIPKQGPLFDELTRLGIPVEAQDLWVLRKSYGVSGLLLRGFLLPVYVARAVRAIRSADLVYVNTSVIVDYLLAARAGSRRVVIHVHEIPGEKALSVFRRLVAFSKSLVLFNSHAARDAFALDRALPQVVVHNGIDIPVAPGDGIVGSTRPEAGRVRLLLIGRINSWKGQDTLVEALSRLPPAIRAALEVRIVGDVFEKQGFREDLETLVRERQLGDVVRIEGFQPDPGPLYAWSDAVLVPSKKPEPFGMVAIEAMAHGKPVIAAGHGGLTEIVVPEETGWFHKPDDPDDLARMLQRAVAERASLAGLGRNGRRRYEEQFTLDAFRTAFLNALAKRPGGAAA